MVDRRVVLFGDLDNVFSALCLQAPEAAEIFVAEPGRWLDWIAQRDARQPGLSLAGPAILRRILARRWRCRRSKPDPRLSCSVLSAVN
jgi:hypothetical protein